MQRLRREGFEERSGKGSHRIFRLDGRKVVVASHSGDTLGALLRSIPTGTLRQICKHSEIAERFARAGWEWPPAR